MVEEADEAAQGCGGDGLGVVARRDVGGAALDHDHFRGGLGEVGEEGDGRGAAADDDDALVRVIEVLGPELRVDYAAFEGLEAGDRGGAWGLVVVVAGSENDELSLYFSCEAVMVHGQCPLLGLGRPVHRLDFVSVSDAVIDAVLLYRVLEIFFN